MDLAALFGQRSALSLPSTFASSDTLRGAMRITIVTGAFLPVPPIMGGAVEKFWGAAGREFARQGHRVTHISRAVSDFSRRETREGVEHIRVRGYDTPSSLWRLKLLDLLYSLRVRRALPPADILVTNTFWLPFLAGRADLGKLYVHVARAPKGQMRFYGKAARLQAPSSVIAQAIEREAPVLQDRIVVLPYAAPAPISGDAPLPFEMRDRVVLFVGRVHPEKGVHLLVQAFMQECDGALRGWTLRIVGPTEVAQGGGGESYLRQLREVAGSPGRVQFSGPIFDPIELEHAYRRARLFVYPSLAETGETFGLAALEAMTYGCAVLVSGLACFRDFIEDGLTGFVFGHRAPDPVRALREKITQLLSDEPLLSSVGEAGWRKSSEYSLERVARQFLDDFASLD